MSLFDEFGAVLRWHEKFHAQYPNFGLWTIVVAGKRSLALIYTRFEQRDQVVKTFMEISDIMRQRDAFWAEVPSTGSSTFNKMSVIWILSPNLLVQARTDLLSKPRICVRNGSLNG